MKKAEFIILSTLFVTALLFTACSISKPKCTRTDNVGFWDIGTELNKVYHCPLMSMGCSGNNRPAEFELKQYYDLWSLATFDINSEAFTIAEQDALLQSARTRAVAEAPLCASGQKKSIYDITFFVDVITADPNPPGYVIGMKVTYACCSGGIQK